MDYDYGCVAMADHGSGSRAIHNVEYKCFDLVGLVEPRDMASLQRLHLLTRKPPHLNRLQLVVVLEGLVQRSQKIAAGNRIIRLMCEWRVVNTVEGRSDMPEQEQRCSQ